MPAVQSPGVREVAPSPRTAHDEASAALGLAERVGHPHPSAEGGGAVGSTMQDRIGQHSTGQDETGQTKQLRTGQRNTGTERNKAEQNSGQDRIRQDRQAIQT